MRRVLTDGAIEDGDRVHDRLAVFARWRELRRVGARVQAYIRHPSRSQSVSSWTSCMRELN